LIIKTRSSLKMLLVGSLLATAGIGGVLAPPALADLDSWSCPNYSSAQTCWAGTGYRGYIEVVATLGATRSEVCAKAVTAAGNIRTGSGCQYNAFYRRSCLAGSSPNSAAYVYWAGSGSAINVYGQAATPSSSGC
jgi:hypothetical protein